MDIETADDSYVHDWRTERGTAVIALNRFPIEEGIPTFHRGTYDSSIPLERQSTLRRCYHSITNR